MAIRLRRAVPNDAAMVADVYLASYRSAYRFAMAHTDEEVRAWIREVVIPAGDTWVAARNGGAVVGMMVLDGAQLDQLYIAPRWTGLGIGTRLVELAKRLRPDGLSLYTFQVNHGARRFYERHGFVPVDQTDGSRNEERQPDVRYAWPGKRPDR